MKAYQALLPLLAATALIAGCESKGNAQMIIQQADASMEKVRPDAASTPEQLKPVEATLAHMKQNFNQGEYKAVKQELPQLNAQYKTLVEAIQDKQSENAAVIQEWSTLNNEVPQAMDAVQARVDSLKPNALPKGVTAEEFATARKDLVAAKATWDEATHAANQGNPTEARDKARIVQAKMEELKNKLAMDERVANNTPGQ
jgi:predicted  nucleic acid-binding Zn-ribbon protein